MKKVLITGGAGYIGSHCSISLINHGYTPVIIDNFSNSHPGIIKKLEKITQKKIMYYKFDLRNKNKIKNIFNKHEFKAVIHFAGFKSVEKSVKDPLLYFNNNIESTLTLLECMKSSNVFNFIFSSSASVYNQREKIPLNEKCKVGKKTSPYGTSKYIVERILKDLSNSDAKWKIGVARYFNVVANHPSGLIGDFSKSESTNLIPIIVKVIKKELPFIKVYGDNYKTIDGTCIRDYVHVMDLAEGHVKILMNIKKIDGFDIYNFGSGEGISVKEVIKAFEKKFGITIPTKIVGARKGDRPISLCDTKRTLNKISWKAKKNLDQIILDVKATL